MRRGIFVALCLCLPVAVFAQPEKGKESAVCVSFIPPMSTQGMQADVYSNVVSFNILAGISENERAFTFGGLMNLVKKDIRGFQFAGLYNYAGHDGQGMMLGGLGNTVGNAYRGVQFAGLLNTTRQMTGFQFAGLLNLSGGETKGLQFGGLGNMAKDVHGVQFGGLFNVAGKVRGVQFAGLVNIAESSDYPIAILNIIKKGEYGAGLVLDDKGSLLAELRSGGRVTYGILGLGYNYKAEGDGFTTEAGFGVHRKVCTMFRINLEIKGGSIGSFSDDPTFYTNVGIFPAVRLFSLHVELFAGPTLNYMRSDNGRNSQVFSRRFIFRRIAKGRREQVFVGGQAGLHYIF